MVYVYKYKTPDGVEHAGERAARDKEAVYAALRAEGVRAYKVEPKDRASLERRLRGRTVAALVFGAAALAAAATWFFFATPWSVPPPGSADVAEVSAPRVGERVPASPRRPVDFSALDLAVALTRPAERVLAGFAVPGDPPPEDVDAEAFRADLTGALASALVVEPSDSPEAVALKRVVTGLKEEAALYRRNGNSAREILELFLRRQEMECAYRAQLVGELPAADAPDFDVRKKALNARLGALGFRLEP